MMGNLRREWHLYVLMAASFALSIAVVTGVVPL